MRERSVSAHVLPEDPSLLYWLWGADHRLAHAEVEYLTGLPTRALARGLVASGAHDLCAVRRLAYTRCVMQWLGHTQDFVPPFDAREVVSGTFAVKGHALEAVGGSATTDVVPALTGGHTAARTAGELVWDSLPSLRVDFQHPETEIHMFLTTDGVYWGRLLFAADPHEFDAREPHRRPFWRSMALPSRKARCLVNLSGVQPGERLLDPFCGTGSIPIEAALMGVRSVASDVDWAIATGAARNFKALGLEEIEVRRVDARDWADTGQRFDAIVADLPYGRSASIKGVDRDALYGSFLDTAAKSLKSHGRAVLMAPEGTLPVPPRSLPVVNRFREYVHGTLTREVTVLEQTA